jgi:hypothetical protein
MDDSTATKLYAGLKLRATEYRASAEAREKYLRLARGHEALADKVEHLERIPVTLHIQHERRSWYRP